MIEDVGDRLNEEMIIGEEEGGWEGGMEGGGTVNGDRGFRSLMLVTDVVYQIGFPSIQC